MLDLAAQLDAVLGPPPILNDLNVRQPPPVSIPEELRKAVAAKCRRDFEFFVKQAWHVLEPGNRLIWNWHLKCITDDAQLMVEELARAKADESYVMRWQNYLANIPPRSGKSRLLAVFLPAWIWVNHPSWTIRCLSANPQVSARDSRDCRELIASDWYQRTFKPTWRIKGDVDAVGLFTNTARGSRRSHGLTAKVTGEGSDIILVDDPHDAAEARSEAVRATVMGKWDSSIRNRINSARANLRIGIMQRLHEDDWTGHVLQRELWIHRVIPMEFETSRECKCAFCSGAMTPFRDWQDPRTKDGELLQPRRFSLKFVQDEKRALGSYGYAGQHQQRPAPADGGRFKFKSWRFWKPDGVAPDEIAPRPDKCYAGPARALPSLTAFSQILISVDCAFRKTAGSDRVAMFVIGVHGADRYVLDRRCDRMTFRDTLTALTELSVAWPRATAKLIEGKANGDAVVDFLKPQIGGLITVDPEGGKESRAAVLEPAVEAGNWFLPDGASWLDDFVGEFATFPLGANDDQVDALSQAAVRLQGSQHLARAMMLCGAKI